METIKQQITSYCVIVRAIREAARVLSGDESEGELYRN